MKQVFLLITLAALLLGSGCSTDSIPPSTYNGAGVNIVNSQTAEIENLKKEIEEIKRVNTQDQQTEKANAQTQKIITPTYTPPVAPTPTFVAPTTCCKYCSKGKACGDSCISRSYTCHKAPGCACDSY